MTAIALIFPHQLYQHHPALSNAKAVALIEDELFFRQYRFHKKKLILHRASMKAYEAQCRKTGIRTAYYDAIHYPTRESVIVHLIAQGYTDAHVAQTDDYLLERRLNRYAKHNGLHLHRYPSPGFLCDMDYVKKYFVSKKRYFLTDFYIDQRKRMDLLLDDQGPVGGKWTFDTENRRKLPASIYVPPAPAWSANVYVEEAKTYVHQHFPNAWGSSDHFEYPVTHADALHGLRSFLSERLQHFGVYQDAMTTDQSVLFHSLLTPALNTGLLTPQEVVDETLAYADQHPVPINSLEGFLRQIIGWREFVRAIYHLEGVHQRTSNHWQHKHPIPTSLYTATTGMVPVDTVIRRVMQTGYAHHIERLMVLGNFMFLCGFHPSAVYQWFMELFIDAYDWVMVPNVYGMSQYADGGLMCTKPYISGSNYILKMSNYPKGVWCDNWDALYWSFISDHREELIRNPRMSMMVRLYDKMDDGRKRKLNSTREKFMQQLLSA